VSCDTLDNATMNHSNILTIISASQTSSGVLSLKAAAFDLHLEILVIAPDDENIIELLGTTDRVIYRFGPKNYSKYANLLPLISNKPRYILEKSIGAFDKINTYKILSTAGIPIPKSWIVKKDYLYDGNSFVIKIANGNQGLGVEKINSQKDLDDFFETYAGDDEFLAQEFIAEAEARDKRLFVIGNKVVAAMERISLSDDFRANLHLGAAAQNYEPSLEEIEIALKSIEAFGLDYGGVDIIDSSRGPLVLEVNPSPGFGISKITGVDVAKELIRYISEEYKK